MISFAIDYDSCAASNVEEFLLVAVKVYQIGLIVATLYGSYFANTLSAKLAIPFIATNPCVCPLISLKKLSPDYCMREEEYFKSRSQEYQNNWEKSIFRLKKVENRNKNN